MIMKNEHLERRLRELGGIDMFARRHNDVSNKCMEPLDSDEFIARADAVAKRFAEHFGLKTNDESPTQCTIVDGGCIVTGSGGHETL